MNNVKKAAMFGLDARIALAIFGALSVISGAALYSAIKESKTTALITEIEEHGKAWEEYMLNTGENLPRLSTTPSSDSYYYLRTQFLINKPAGVNNWQGPYLNYEVTDTNYLLHKTLGKMALVEASDDTNWGNTINIASGYCTSGKKCFLWLHFSGASKELTESLENRFNEPNTPTYGKIKWYYINDANQYRVFYKLQAVPNPHD